PAFQSVAPAPLLRAGVAEIAVVAEHLGATPARDLGRRVRAAVVYDENPRTNCMERRPDACENSPQCTGRLVGGHDDPGRTQLRTHAPLSARRANRISGMKLKYRCLSRRLAIGR